MKKIFFNILFLFVFLPLLFAKYGTTTTIQIRGVTDDVVEIPVGTSVTVFSKSFDLSRGTKFSLGYKASSDGIVNIAMYLEQDNEKPSAEGADDTDWVDPEGTSAIDTITDEDWHKIAIDPIAERYGRVRFEGASDNDSSGTVEIYLSKVEDI